MVTLWKIHVIGQLLKQNFVMSNCANDMHGTTSRSWLVNVHVLHIHVIQLCPSDCLVYIPAALYNEHDHMSFDK
jgi:hypothetical protein